MCFIPQKISDSKTNIGHSDAFSLAAIFLAQFKRNESNWCENFPMYLFPTVFMEENRLWHFPAGLFDLFLFV